VLNEFLCIFILVYGNCDFRPWFGVGIAHKVLSLPFDILFNKNKLSLLCLVRAHVLNAFVYFALN